MINVSNLSFRYNEKKILNELNLEIRSGEFVSICGPNGAGKSTLLRLISKILQPSSGTIQIAGREIESWTIKELSKKLAVLPAETITTYDFTVREIVAMGRTPHLDFWTEENAEDENIIEESLLSVGIQELADRRITNLSSGERQLVYLAQALAQRTELLFLDEPTAHLDLQHQIKILDILKDWNQRKKTTILLVSHDIRWASCYAQRLLFLKDGKVCIDGTPEKVYTKQTIKTVYGVDVDPLWV